MVYAFPKNETLWRRYAEIRAESFCAGDEGRAATEFYRQHRDEMDLGAQVAWAERFNPDELSALQHAMNLKLQDEAAFHAEYQNQPLPEVHADEGLLTADQIAAKTNGMVKWAIPIACQYLTMFIDVQQNLLYYAVVAWEENFNGYVIEYSAFPDQKRPYFTLRDARLTLGLATKEAGVEGAIYAGLKAVTEAILGHSFRRDDGAELKIGRCLIDANWGTSTDVVYQFCRQSLHSAILTPSHGRFVGASSRPFSEYRKSPGEQLGLNWFIPNVTGKRAIRHVLFDANYWKSFVHARLKVPMGDRGCLSLYGQEPNQHRLLSEHLTAEYRVKTTGRGRTVDEWKIRPERPDNHWLDCLVGASVAASMQGASLEETGPARPPKKKRLSLSEMQSEAHARRGYVAATW